MPTSTSRRSSAVATLGACLLAPLAAHAQPAAELQGYMVGGAANGAGYSFIQQDDSATASSSIVKSLTDTDSEGSYADGRLAVGFGTLHSYADAHEVTLAGHAPQSNVESEFVDYIKPWESSPVGYTAYTLTLDLNGSHSPTAGYGAFPGYSAEGQVGYEISDNRTGFIFASQTFDTTDATPAHFTLGGPISIPPAEATDDLRIEVTLSAYTYVDNGNPAYQTAVADYSNTLVTHLDALTPGASTLGVSGHDYATVASVPEPSTGCMLLAGLAAIGVRARARRSARLPG